MKKYFIVAVFAVALLFGSYALASESNLSERLDQIETTILSLLNVIEDEAVRETLFTLMDRVNDIRSRMEEETEEEIDEAELVYQALHGEGSAFCSFKDWDGMTGEAYFKAGKIYIVADAGAHHTVVEDNAFHYWQEGESMGVRGGSDFLDDSPISNFESKEGIAEELENLGAACEEKTIEEGVFEIPGNVFFLPI